MVICVILPGSAHMYTHSTWIHRAVTAIDKLSVLRAGGRGSEERGGGRERERDSKRCGRTE